MRRSFSPRHLADALGVSESSVKRWVDGGLLRAARTAGGHRKIEVAEALRFLRESSTPLARPEVLGLDEVRAAEGTTRAEDIEESFHDALIDGKQEVARGLVLGRYLAGDPVAALCDGPLRLALTRIGELWHRGPHGILVEHRATEICVAALHGLRAILAPPADAPLAMGGAVSGDRSAIPSLMAALVVESEGARAVNLGPDTPHAALLEAVTEHQPFLLWRCVGHALQPESLSEELGELIPVLESSGARLAIGGREAPSLTIPRSTRILVGSRMGDLAAYVRGLLAYRNPNSR